MVYHTQQKTGIGCLGLILYEKDTVTKERYFGGYLHVCLERIVARMGPAAFEIDENHPTLSRLQE